MGKNKKQSEEDKAGGSQVRDVSTKPKFDKKKWREKKYSNKFKVAVWEKRRQKAVIQQYYKEFKNDESISKSLKPKENVSQNGDSSTNQSNIPATSTSIGNQKKKRFNAYETAKAEMQRIKNEKEKHWQEKLRKKEEMNQKLAEYKKKRADRYKVLSKKNKKGQPVMKGRLELLYEQIKQSTA